MGYLKVTSPDSRMPAKVTVLPRPGDAALRARRSASTNGAKPHLPRADQIALSKIAQRFAPGPGQQVTPAAAAEEQRFAPGAGQQAAPAAVVADQRFESPPPQVESAPVAASPRGMRTLIAVLIAVALLPSLLFGAMISLGAIQVKWLQTETKTWPAATPASVAGTLVKAEPKQALEAPEARTAALPSPEPQESAPPAPAEPVPEAVQDPESMGSAAPTEAAQEPESTGSVAPVEEPAEEPELPYDTNLIGVVSWDEETQPLLGASGVEEVFTAPEEPAEPPELLMRAPEASADDKTWITPSEFVNLRKGPTSSAAVLGVIAKGAKLEVKGRKRGWVQVTNPETSESGWIYAGSKARRSAKRGSESASNESTSWLGSLLGNR